MREIKDVKFHKQMIDVSIKAADESSGSIRDVFLEQASRLYSELMYHVSLNSKSKAPKGKRRKVKRKNG